MALGRKTGGRKAGVPNKRTAEAEAQAEAALQHLVQALHDLLPDQPACGHARQLDALARRITVGTTSTADLAVLTALPADALAILGMKPGRFVIWLQGTPSQH